MSEHKTLTASAFASCELRIEWRAPKLGERGWIVSAHTPEEALREVLRESEELGWIADHDHAFVRDDDDMVPITIVLGGSPERACWKAPEAPPAGVDAQGLAQQAMEAFFARLADIARTHYGVTTGDLAPDHDFAFGQACERVVLAWLAANRPQRKTTTITVELEIEHNLDVDTLQLVYNELDAGTLQDALKEQAEGCGLYAKVSNAKVVP